MAIFYLDLDVDLGLAAKAMHAFSRRSRLDLMKRLGALAEGQTKRRFATENDPDGRRWKPLKPSAIARRRKRSKGVLKDTGRLMGSISHTATSTTAIVGTNVAYGPFHQFGTKKMSARPFLGFGDTDRSEIRRAVMAYLEGII